MTGRHNHPRRYPLGPLLAVLLSLAAGGARAAPELDGVLARLAEARWTDGDRHRGRADFERAAAAAPAASPLAAAAREMLR